MTPGSNLHLLLPPLIIYNSDEHVVGGRSTEYIYSQLSSLFNLLCILFFFYRFFLKTFYNWCFRLFVRFYPKIPLKCIYSCLKNALTLSPSLNAILLTKRWRNQCNNTYCNLATSTEVHISIKRSKHISMIFFNISKHLKIFSPPDYSKKIDVIGHGNSIGRHTPCSNT